MATLTSSERHKADDFAQLAYGNPFLETRIDAERRLLGSRFTPGAAVWSWTATPSTAQLNIQALQQEAELLARRLRSKVISDATDADRRRYADVATYALYYRGDQDLLELIAAERVGQPTNVPPAMWRRFKQSYDELFEQPGIAAPCDAAAFFAAALQTRRAFLTIFNRLIGSSAASATLRAEVWQSIFTHDRRRHLTHLCNRMRDLPTLITGASGTGKEIVAGAIAAAQFRPFEPATGRLDSPGLFLPMNLAAIPETLAESTLFGHKRGSFTGAMSDHRGGFEQVDAHGCLFLDELGDASPAIQVKLLRVLQERTFQRVGDLRERRFEGKVLAATNRDLSADIERGTFRRDLFYRLSGDLIRTPTLQDQIAGDADELHRLLAFVAARVAGQEAAGELAEQSAECVRQHLGLEYAWPGNFRELEQCVRNVMVRNRYRPQSANAHAPTWLTAAAQGSLTADELLDHYTAAAYERHGTYDATGRALQIDRRTVKARVERARKR